LDGELRLKSKPNIRFAGQITGCEGYVESAAIGLIAARFAAAELRGAQAPAPPIETALGALLAHITGGADAATYQPMNVNFGLMPPPEARTKKADRKKAYTDRARAALAQWLATLPPLPPAGGDRGVGLSTEHRTMEIQAPA
jgi:methylenetetrahydrofolate--tRNA-(uracil-5-)-methyltransferase